MLSLRSISFARLVALMLAIALALSSVAIAAAQADENQDQDLVQTTIDDILDDPDEFVGGATTIRAEVEEVLTPQAFTVRSEATGETLLVTGASRLIPGEVSPGATVRTTGRVRIFDENTYSFADLGIDPNDETLSAFQGEPTLVANQPVQVLQTGQRERPDEERQFLLEEQQFLEEERQQIEEEIQQLEEEGAPQRQIRQREQELQQVEQELLQIEQEIQRLEQQAQLERQRQAEQVTVRELVRNPEDFAGQRVQLTGDLEETLLPHLFALDAGRQQVLVLAAPQEVPDVGAEQVDVIGTVHVFTLGDLLRSLGIDISGSALALLGGMDQLILIAAEQVTTTEQDQQLADDEIQQLEEEQQFLEEERQQLEEEIQQLEEEGAPQRQIRQREQELQQVEQELRQVEQEIQRLEQQGQDEQDGQPDQAEQATVTDILQEPGEFAGTGIVAVRGRVDETFGRNAFTIVQGRQQILVIGERGAIPSNVTGRVEVTGEVRESFDAADIEDELGITLSDRLVEDRNFANQPFIMAQDVETVQQ